MSMEMHSKMVHEITVESSKPSYSAHALPLMLEALESAEKYIAQGKDVRDVLCGHFNGRLLARLLKVAGCAPYRKEDAYGTGIRRTVY